MVWNHKNGTYHFWEWGHEKDWSTCSFFCFLFWGSLWSLLCLVPYYKSTLFSFFCTEPCPEAISPAGTGSWSPSLGSLGDPTFLLSVPEEGHLKAAPREVSWGEFSHQEYPEDMVLFLTLGFIELWWLAHWVLSPHACGWLVLLN